MIARASEGERHACIELYRIAGELANKWRLGEKGYGRDDLVQDTILRILEIKEDYDPIQGAISTFMANVMRTIAVGQFKKASRKINPSRSHRRSDSLRNDPPQPIEPLYATERRQQVYGALNRLRESGSTEYTDALQLRYHVGEPNITRCANANDMPGNTLRSQVSRGRDLLGMMPELKEVY